MVGVGVADLCALTDKKDFLSAATNVVHCYAVVRHVISLTLATNYQATLSVMPAFNCVG